MLDIKDLRNWDFNLLDIYKSTYSASIKVCRLCALGPCSFSKGGYGRCGIGEEGFKAREVLLASVIGASGHTSLARRLLEDLTSRYDHDCLIDTPLITLIYGTAPQNLGNMEEVLSYAERELAHLLSSINYGTEASPEDFISKALHAGMLDNLVLEIADIVQITALNLPKGGSDSPIVATGPAQVDKNSPFILIIGHNSLVGAEILSILEEKGLLKDIEVGGLCCAASDLLRHHHGTKIIGSQADQLEVIRSGIADVIVLDTQCIRADAISEARRAGSLVVATTQETTLGLLDLTPLSSEMASEAIVSEGLGVIFDKKKAAEVAVLSALSYSHHPSPITHHLRNGEIRIGRGPIRDSEIRGVAPSIVMGEIPGIVGLFGCPEEDPSDICKIARELLSRGYIVATGGCSAIDLGKESDLFRNHRDSFDAGNLINLGSCISASHLLGACIKIARVISHRSIKGNYREIADYIINRVGAVLVLWGGFTQKAFATALGAVRLGIPVLLGPRGKKYGLHLFGKAECSILDARLGDRVNTSPHPSHLLCSADNLNEAFSLIAQLCIRHSDTTQGRRIKLGNYIELYKNATGKMPEDLSNFIRTDYDIPEGMEDGIRSLLYDWRPGWIPDPTLLPERVRSVVSGNG